MKVNQQRIPDIRFEQEWQRLHQARKEDPFLQQLDENQLREITRENVVNQILLEQEAVRRYGKQLDKDVRDEQKAFLERHGGEKEYLRKNRLKKQDLDTLTTDILRRLAVNKLLDKLFVDIGRPTEKEAFDEYMKNPSAFATPEQVHASHIVKHTNDGTDPKDAFSGIQEVKRRLDDGQEFNAVAEELSDCAAGAQDLGCFPRGQMVQEFEDVVFSMKPGAVSEIFKTDFGYHIAMVHERRAATARPFDEVKDSLIEFMYRRQQNETIEGLVSTLRKKASIEN